MKTMKIWKSSARVCLLLTALLLLLAGCTDYEQLKAELLQAVSKQEEIKSYRFTGTVELKADASLIGQASPFAAALFAMLKDSKIEYSGISALEPSRLESNLKITPAGGSPIDIPVLIKDSKLFFHMPALNKDDEYMMLPVQAKQSGNANAAGNPDPLTNSGHVSAALHRQLLNGIEPEWLQPSKEQVTLADGTIAKRITINIDAKNETAFSEYWIQVLPAFTELLQTNGLATGASDEAWQSWLKQVKFHAPTTVEMLIDNEGYIHEQKWNVRFTTGGSTKENHLVWTQSLSEINQNPAFTKDIPEKQKSLEELLKLVKPASK